jgi:hypothetical protein
MVVIEEGTIKGLNGVNVEIQTDDLIAFKDKLRSTGLDDAKEITSLKN